MSQPLKEGNISALASHKDFTFVASAGQIHIYKRAKYDSMLESELEADYEISQLLVLGDLLLAVCSDNAIQVWDHSKRGMFNQVGKCG